VLLLAKVLFVGANSSGKTNIIRSLQFLRTALDRYIFDALHDEGWGEGLRTLGVDSAQPFGFSVGFVPTSAGNELTYNFQLRSDQTFSHSTDTLYWIDKLLTDTSGTIWMEASNQWC
jgi:predicted ATPase